VTSGGGPRRPELGPSYLFYVLFCSSKSVNPPVVVTTLLVSSAHRLRRGPYSHLSSSPPTAHCPHFLKQERVAIATISAVGIREADGFFSGNGRRRELPIALPIRLAQPHAVQGDDKSKPGFKIQHLRTSSVP
jgi:hypothetical protein